MGRNLLFILGLSLVVLGIVDERSKQLDKEYEKLLGEKVSESEDLTEKKPQQESEVGFNPHDDLTNEEFKKWANGEPYMLAKSKAKTEGYVCQQFTLPSDGGTSLKLVSAADLNACKCACNEERGGARESGRVGCNAFAYLAGQSTGETNVTVNECHLKRHFLYHADWQKVSNPWIFCVQEGDHVPAPTAPKESQVAALSSPVATTQTIALMGASALISGLAVFFATRGRFSKHKYLLMVEEAEI